LPETARRGEELEAGHGSAGLHHPSQLTERGLGIIDVTQQVRKGQRVEGAIGEGQLLGPAGNELDPTAHGGIGDVAVALSQHRLRQIHTDNFG